MTRQALFALLCIGFVQVAPGHEIATEELGPGRYRLVLKSTTLLEVPKAQSLLYPSAIELCRGLQPVLGNYEFSSSAPIKQQSSSIEKTEFRLAQDISCGTAASSASIGSNRHSSLGVLKTDPNQSLEAFVRAASITYLTQRAEGNFDQAHIAFSEVMRTFQSADEWKKQTSDFNAAAGRRKATSIWRVTIYDNPANAPEPGIYIAADYESEFERVPFQCGYLIWYQSSDNRYVITREETGSLPGALVATLSKDKIADIRRQFGCPTP